MLRELSVTDFAIIDSATLQLEPGFNVLTGETGAGKSILIDAVQALLGSRVTADMVKTGSEDSYIEALFEIDADDVTGQKLADAGISATDGQLVITRQISRTGRNVCRANGRVVPVQLLKDLVGQMIDICGQHAHQSLNSPDQQLLVVDRFAGSECVSQRHKVGRLHDQYMEQKQRLEQSRSRIDHKKRKIDDLRFTVSEIENVDEKPGEWDELCQQKQLLANAELLQSAAATAFELIYEASGNSSAVDLLGQAEQSLEQGSRIDDKLALIGSEIKECLYRLESCGHDLASYRDGVDFDPEMLAAVEQRLESLREMRRKYGDDYEDIKQYYDNATDELEQLTDSSEQIDRLKHEVNKTGELLRQAAQQLTEMRIEASKHISDAVSSGLGELGLSHARFSVRISGKNDIVATGQDKCQMLFSANPDEQLLPVSKVASGGELARLMLVIKSVLADRDHIRTVVFDEVDANIGGLIVQALADKISDVSQNRQVLCITHQPQIAAVADAHIGVGKSVIDQKTRVDVRRFNEFEREQEIARMLGGTGLTTVTVDHARQLLNRKRKIDNG